MDDPRLRLLDLPHIAPLMTLVRSLRDRGLRVPNIDPYDGGTGARAMFLSETPGPKAVGSFFVSRDNPDPSARNITTALDQAGFARDDVFLWNVVPQCVATEARNRNATAREIRNAIPHTQAFIAELRRLRVIIFCGRQAQRAIPYLVIPEHVTALSTFFAMLRKETLRRSRLK
jgi:uracil-DNA glycosylase family 4